MKRGWIGIATRTKLDYSRPGDVTRREEITVGTITAMTRDGHAKRLKPAHGGCEITNDYAHGGWAHLYTLDPERFADRGAAFLAIAAARQTPNPDTWRPWESIEDVRETARQFVSVAS